MQVYLLCTLSFDLSSAIFISMQFDVKYFDRLEEIMKGSLVQPPDVLKLVAHQVHWNLVPHLLYDDYRLLAELERKRRSSE
jgi:hypothetical protein